MGFWGVNGFSFFHCVASPLYSFVSSIQNPVRSRTKEGNVTIYAVIYAMIHGKIQVMVRWKQRHRRGIATNKPKYDVRRLIVRVRPFDTVSYAGFAVPVLMS